MADVVGSVDVEVRAKLDRLDQDLAAAQKRLEQFGASASGGTKQVKELQDATNGAAESARVYQQALALAQSMTSAVVAANDNASASYREVAESVAATNAHLRELQMANAKTAQSAEESSRSNQEASKGWQESGRSAMETGAHLFTTGKRILEISGYLKLLGMVAFAGSPMIRNLVATGLEKWAAITAPAVAALSPAVSGLGRAVSSVTPEFVKSSGAATGFGRTMSSLGATVRPAMKVMDAAEIVAIGAAFPMATAGALAFSPAVRQVASREIKEGIAAIPDGLRAIAPAAQQAGNVVLPVLNGMLASAARVAGPILAVVAAWKAMDAVTQLGAEQIKVLKGISDEARAAGVSTETLQRAQKSAGEMGVSVESVTAAYKNFAEAVKVTDNAQANFDATMEVVEASIASTTRSVERSAATFGAFHKRLEALRAEGNFASNAGVALFENATTTEQKFKAAVELISTALEQGQKLAAISLAKTFLPDEIVSKLESSSGFLRKMQEEMAKIEKNKLFTQADIDYAADITRRLGEAEKILSERWEPVMRALTRLGLEFQESWITTLQVLGKIGGVIGDIVEGVEKMGPAIKRGFAPLTSIGNSPEDEAALKLMVEMWKLVAPHIESAGEAIKKYHEEEVRGARIRAAAGGSFASRVGERLQEKYVQGAVNDWNMLKRAIDFTSTAVQAQVSEGAKVAAQSDIVRGLTTMWELAKPTIDAATAAVQKYFAEKKKGQEGTAKAGAVFEGPQQEGAYSFEGPTRQMMMKQAVDELSDFGDASVMAGEHARQLQAAIQGFAQAAGPAGRELQRGLQLDELGRRFDEVMKKLNESPDMGPIKFEEERVKWTNLYNKAREEVLSSDPWSKEVERIQRNVTALQSQSAGLGKTQGFMESFRAELSLLQAAERGGGSVTQEQIDKYTQLRGSMSANEALMRSGINLVGKQAEQFERLSKAVGMTRSELDLARRVAPWKVDVAEAQARLDELRAKIQELQALQSQQQAVPAPAVQSTPTPAPATPSPAPVQSQPVAPRPQAAIDPGPALVSMQTIIQASQAMGSQVEANVRVAFGAFEEGSVKTEQAAGRIESSFQDVGKLVGPDWLAPAVQGVAKFKQSIVGCNDCMALFADNLGTNIDNGEYFGEVFSTDPPQGLGVFKQSIVTSNNSLATLSNGMGKTIDSAEQFATRMRSTATAVNGALGGVGDALKNVSSIERVGHDASKEVGLVNNATGQLQQNVVSMNHTIVSTGQSWGTFRRLGRGAIIDVQKALEDFRRQQELTARLGFDPRSSVRAVMAPRVERAERERAEEPPPPPPTDRFRAAPPPTQGPTPSDVAPTITPNIDISGAEAALGQLQQISMTTAEASNQALSAIGTNLPTDMNTAMQGVAAETAAGLEVVRTQVTDTNLADPLVRSMTRFNEGIVQAGAATTEVLGGALGQVGITMQDMLRHEQELQYLIYSTMDPIQRATAEYNLQIQSLQARTDLEREAVIRSQTLLSLAGTQTTQTQALAAAERAVTLEREKGNQAHRDAMGNINNQLALANAATAAERNMVQEIIRQNQLRQQGLSPARAAAQAAGERAVAEAQATNAVRQQITALQQQIQLINARANGTEAAVRGEQAYINAINSGADAQEAAQLAALTREQQLAQEREAEHQKELARIEAEKQAKEQAEQRRAQAAAEQRQREAEAEAKAYAEAKRRYEIFVAATKFVPTLYAYMEGDTVKMAGQEGKDYWRKSDGSLTQFNPEGYKSNVGPQPINAGGLYVPGGINSGGYEFKPVPGGVGGGRFEINQKGMELAIDEMLLKGGSPMGSINEILSKTQGKPMGSGIQQDQVQMINRLLELIPEDNKKDRQAALEATLAKVREQPVTLAREELIKDLNEKIKALKESTDENTESQDEILSGLYGRQFGQGFYDGGLADDQKIFGLDSPEKFDPMITVYETEMKRLAKSGTENTDRLVNTFTAGTDSLGTTLTAINAGVAGLSKEIMGLKSNIVLPDPNTTRTPNPTYSGPLTNPNLGNTTNTTGQTQQQTRNVTINNENTFNVPEYEDRFLEGASQIGERTARDLMYQSARS